MILDRDSAPTIWKRATDIAPAKNEAAILRRVDSPVMTPQECLQDLTAKSCEVASMCVKAFSTNCSSKVSTHPSGAGHRITVQPPLKKTFTQNRYHVSNGVQEKSNKQLLENQSGKAIHE